MPPRIPPTIAAAITTLILATAPATAGDLTVDGSLISTRDDGTPPLAVASSVQVDNLNADLLDGQQASDFQNAFHRIVVVAADTGTEYGNATALLDAVAAITDASGLNRYLIQLEPGVYQLGSRQLIMKPWVSIQGSGPGVTQIIGSGSSGLDAVVVAADNTSLSDLSMTASVVSSPTYAIALMVDGTSPRLSHLEVTANHGNASTGFALALAIQNAGDPQTHDMHLSGSGGASAWGLWVFNASPTLTDVDIVASGGDQESVGIYSSDNAAPTLRRVVIDASSAPNAQGVRCTSNSTIHLVDSDITATASSEGNGLEWMVGSAARTATIYHSRIEGSTNGLLGADSFLKVDAATSRIVGGTSNVTTGGGDFSCYAVFNENLVPLSPSCGLGT